jgi:hypothetical protein
MKSSLSLSLQPFWLIKDLGCCVILLAAGSSRLQHVIPTLLDLDIRATALKCPRDTNDWCLCEHFVPVLFLAL